MPLDSSASPDTAVTVAYPGLSVFRFQPDKAQPALEVRSLRHQGEPTFVLADLCRGLDVCMYSNKPNVSMAKQVLEDKEFYTLGVSDTYPWPFGRSARSIIVVTRPGLYRLIARSRKPQAKVFQDWLYHEVLPSLEATGTYTMPGAAPPAPAAPSVDLSPIPQAIQGLTEVVGQLVLLGQKPAIQSSSAPSMTPKPGVPSRDNRSDLSGPLPDPKTWGPHRSRDRFSDNEAAVGRMKASGMSRRDIAAQLGGREGPLGRGDRTASAQRPGSSAGEAHRLTRRVYHSERNVIIQLMLLRRRSRCLRWSRRREQP